MLTRIRQLVRSHMYRNAVVNLFVRTLHPTIIGCELLIERVLDKLFLSSATNYDYANVTAVIKTFERPKKLQRLLMSMEKICPHLKIIIVDDSKEPIKINNKAHIEVIHLPFDSGVSEGRKAGFDQVNTKYVVNLDDDYIFTRKTNLKLAIDYLEQNSSVDIVAGEVAYLPYYIRFDYTAHKLMDYSNSPIHEKGEDINGLKVYEKCANFFIANTEKFKTVGWDAKLKRLDHADLYTRARGKLTVVFDPSIELLHDTSHFDQNYLLFRHDYKQDSVVLNKRYPSNSR